jgi:hypothetical protein
LNKQAAFHRLFVEVGLIVACRLLPIEGGALVIASRLSDTYAPFAVRRRVRTIDGW